VARELALIKVAATPKTRSEVFDLVEVFRARIVDLAPESLMIEITGVESKIEGLIQVLNENGERILEVARTGRMVMRRGQHTSKVLEAMRVPGLETADELKAEEASSASDILMVEEAGLQ
jgi:acetolactate synthase-1/3 small subunit